MGSLSAIHYKDDYDNPDEPWKDIDLTPDSHGNITKAPYTMIKDGNSYTLTNKKTGEVASIEPLDAAKPVVVPGNDKVSFRHKITGNSLPFKTNYKITGKGFSFRAFDEDGELAIKVEGKDGVITETIDTVTDKRTGKDRQINGDILLDPTWQVGSGTDDCERCQNSTYFGLTDVNSNIGYISASYYKTGSGFRFTNVNVPKDVIISSSKLTLTGRGSYTGNTVNARISAEATDNPSTFADDYAAFDARFANHTTARVDWDAVATWPTTDVEHDSPDISTVIQEIVNRAGWVSGQAMVLFWEDFDDRSSHGTLTYRGCYTYESDPTKTPKLTIDYIVLPVTRVKTVTGTNDAHLPWAFFINVPVSAVHFVGAVRNRVYCVYQTYLPGGYLGGSGGDPYVFYYDFDTESLYGPWKIADNPLGGDHHSAGAICVDSNDKLHVFYGCHASNLYWTRSVNSLDDETPFTGTGDFETPKQLSGAYTYPCPIIDNSGNLWLFSRIGTAVPNLSIQYQASTNYAGTWSSASFGALTQLTATDYYFGAALPVLDKDGNIILTIANWQADAVSTYNAYFARYNMTLTRWEKADGTEYLTIPIPIGDAELIAANSYDPRAGVDESGNIYICYADRASATSFPRYVKKFSGTTWGSAVQVSAVDYGYAVMEVVNSAAIYVYEVDTDCVRRVVSTDGGASFGSSTLMYDPGIEIGNIVKAKSDSKHGIWAAVMYLGGSEASDTAYGIIVLDTGVAPSHAGLSPALMAILET